MCHNSGACHAYVLWVELGQFGKMYCGRIYTSAILKCSNHWKRALDLLNKVHALVYVTIHNYRLQLVDFAFNINMYMYIEVDDLLPVVSNYV